ncbi:restriction endonuclease [Nesterenkonia sp. K-15-9-6]|uniref:restriction endonuclease n=1 Tax=Nesterenkonia sp. K-15-9-6 TaxID=3093918 RepID=UPI004044F7E0
MLGVFMFGPGIAVGLALLLGLGESDAARVWLSLGGIVLGLVILCVYLGVTQGRSTAVSSSTPAPEPRLVRDADESEELAAEWVRYMGWPKAVATQASGDSGIDVLGTDSRLGGVAAQVKFEAKKTGRPVVQALYGAGAGVDAQHRMLFSSAGYTSQAADWADQMGVGLFRFTLDGSVEAINRAGEDYLKRRHVARLGRAGEGSSDA